MAKVATKLKKKPAKKPVPKTAPKKVTKSPAKKMTKKRAVALSVTAVTPAPYSWEFPRVSGAGSQVIAHGADVEMFERLATAAQEAAKALGDIQNRTTLLAMSPDQVSLLLGKLGRGSGAKLTDREAGILAALVIYANKSALMLPGYSDKEVSVHRLVNLLLSAGNLLQEAALRAKPPAEITQLVTEPSP